MKIEHVAIWVRDLEVMRDFFQTYFKMKCSAKYENVVTGFSSYFLSFDSGARIEIMKRNDVSAYTENKGLANGLTHIAISAGNREAVYKLTQRLRSEGYKVLSEPRTTGDGYYESVISDPEGNFIEITE